MRERGAKALRRFEKEAVELELSSCLLTACKGRATEVNTRNEQHALRSTDQDPAFWRKYRRDTAYVYRGSFVDANNRRTFRVERAIPGADGRRPCCFRPPFPASPRYFAAMSTRLRSLRMATCWRSATVSRGSWGSATRVSGLDLQAGRHPWEASGGHASTPLRPDSTISETLLGRRGCAGDPYGPDIRESELALDFCPCQGSSRVGSKHQLPHHPLWLPYST